MREFYGHAIYVAVCHVGFIGAFILVMCTWMDAIARKIHAWVNVHLAEVNFHAGNQTNHGIEKQ